MSGTRPKHNTTWNDYKIRILRVLTHIHEHLDEPLDLENLARVACFSSFHFHRIFAAMTGETIADYVRRLRLERAAMELSSGATPVVQVALDAGYEAHEAFTRAFKAAYGISPTEFRRTPGSATILPAPSGVHFRQGVPVTTFNTNHITTKVMKIITKQIEPMRVAYLRHVGPYESTSQTWIDLVARLSEEKQVREDSVFIGMGHDNPTITPAAQLRYDACITVGEDYQPKTPVELQTIPGGEYALAKACPVEEIKDAYQYLYGKWLAQSSRELRPVPSFMVLLDAQSKTPSAKRQVDIYMPLQSKRAINAAEQMKIEVTTIKPQRVAYMRHVGPYNGAHHAWMDFMGRLKKVGLPGKDSLFVGVPLDDPKVTPPEKLRYDVCATIDENYEPTKPLEAQTLAGGDYAVARNCPIGTIAKGYEKLYHSWLPTSGRKARKAPSFMVSVNSQEGMPPTFGMTDIYMPLEARKQ